MGLLHVGIFDTTMIDFPLNLRDGNEDFAWRTGSVLLSLDRFERFWPDVGLALSNGEAVKSAVRDVLRVRYAIDEEWRTTTFANPDAPEDLEAPDPTEELANTFFRRINETAGTQDAECVARWILGPVHKAITWPSSGSWSAELYHLSKEEPDMLVSRYKVAGDTARKIVDIAARHRSEIDAIKERTEAADREPLSGWDAVAYAEYRRETPEASPLIGVRLYLTRVGFDRTWHEVVASTIQTDRDALVRWNIDFLKEHGYPIPNYAAIIPENVHGPW